MNSRCERPQLGVGDLRGYVGYEAVSAQKRTGRKPPCSAIPEATQRSHSHAAVRFPEADMDADAKKFDVRVSQNRFFEPSHQGWYARKFG